MKSLRKLGNYLPHFDLEFDEKGKVETELITNLKKRVNKKTISHYYYIALLTAVCAQASIFKTGAPSPAVSLLPLYRPRHFKNKRHLVVWNYVRNFPFIRNA